MNDGKIVLLTEIIDQRLRKQHEIEFYEKELLKIQEKLLMLRREEAVTRLILEMIENEKVMDLQKYVHERVIDINKYIEDKKS